MNEKEEIFLDGKFVKKKDAFISIFDTGFYYGDGIYEVALLCERRLIDFEIHLARLEYSLNEVSFNNAPSKEEVMEIAKELIKRNSHIESGIVYIQITRGVAENRYQKLMEIQKATVVAYIIKTDVSFDVLQKLTSCKLIEEPRRYRRDIKMTSLMPANLAKIDAQKGGFDYVIFKDRETGAITEGASSNLFIVSKDDVVLTHPWDFKILYGCMRKRTIEFLTEEGFEVKEQEFFEEDLLNAKEAFLTGSIKLFAPILSVNGKKIGDGEFKIANLCMQKYKNFIKTFDKIA